VEWQLLAEVPEEAVPPVPIDCPPLARLTVQPGQQTGSKRLKSASPKHGESDRDRHEKPHE
jgi:hypothetical protein